MAVAPVSTPDPISQGAAIEAAMFLNAWIYGDGTLPPEFQGASSLDNGYDDDYDGFITAATDGSWDLLGAADLTDEYFDATPTFTGAPVVNGYVPQYDGFTIDDRGFAGHERGGFHFGPRWRGPASWPGRRRPDVGRRG